MKDRSIHTGKAASSDIRRAQEDQITQFIDDPRRELERMIKKGITGLELVEWVQETFSCSKENALGTIAETARESAAIIKEIFDDNHVIMMAFDLYNRAVETGKIRDAAMILQSIMELVGKGGNPMSKHSMNVQILEMLPENKAGPETGKDP